jgi:hypothetical protein
MHFWLSTGQVNLYTFVFHLSGDQFAGLAGKPGREKRERPALQKQTANSGAH